MLKRVFTFFCLFVFCCGLIAPAGRKGAVSLRPDCLAPLMGVKQSRVVIDAEADAKLGKFATVYSVSGYVVGPDMSHTPASFIVKWCDAKEVRILSALAANPKTSKYVPKIYSVERKDGQWKVIMENLGSGENPFVELEDDIVGRSELENLFVARDLVLALDAIHKAGYVHHDLNFGNMLYRFVTLADGTKRAEVKIIDFGLSRDVDDNSDFEFFGDISREDCMNRNILFDMNALGHRILNIFHHHNQGLERDYELSATEMPLLNKFIFSDYMGMQLRTISNPSIRKMILHMLVPSAADGKYASLRVVSDVMADILGALAVENPILSAA